MPNPKKLQFAPWQRSSLFQLAAGATQGGRLAGELAVDLAEEVDGQERFAATGKAPFRFVGPQDVVACGAGAVVRMAPPPNAVDAETTKLVHVDFAAADYPWRYTPAVNAGNVLKPWLVLLVGTAAEIQVVAGKASIANTVLQDHDLALSHLWAHVQLADGASVARLVSPRGLERPPRPAGLAPQTAHVAVLVPAFNAAGQPAWAVAGGAVTGAPERHRVLHHWTFATAESGDFETLVEDLRVLGDAQLAQRRIGVARLYYKQFAAALPVRGALQRLGADPPLDTNQEAVRAAAKTELGVLIESNPNAAEPEVGLPNFGSAWVADTTIPVWGQQLRTDPRWRALAGLGAWLGREVQEELLDAARQQAGALALARQRVRHLALGVHASRRLWANRLPAEPLRRLWVLGPATARMQAAAGGAAVGTVLAKLTAAPSPLAAALFSGAARRVLRRNAAWTRYRANAPAGTPVPAAEVLAAANTCPPPPRRVTDGLPHADAAAERLDLPVERRPVRFRPIPDSLIAYLKRFGELTVAGDPGANAGVADAIADFMVQLLGNPPVDPNRLVDDIQSHFRANVGARMTVPLLLVPLLQFFVEFGEPLPAAPMKPCRRPDLVKLGDAVAAALDPHGNPPPAKDRVAATIGGLPLATLEPPELPLEFGVPTWTLLRDRAREWLLPGVGALPKNSVIAVQSNPAFIDAFLVGLNTQFKNELHWRDLGDARGGTPFKMFWGPVQFGAVVERTPDIKGVADWPPATPLGDLTHQVVRANDPTGNRNLVIVFRTDLFRRYPTTQVYLRWRVPPNLPDQPLTPAEALARLGLEPDFTNPQQDVGPVFQGTLTPDVTFFMFDVTPEQLPRFWVVLEEPPADLRFRNHQVPPLPPLSGFDHSGTFAKKALDQPTRAAISWGDLSR